MHMIKKIFFTQFLLFCVILYANIDVSKLSDEQIGALLGVGKYDEKEFKNDQEKFYNNEAFWYGIKNIHDQRYGPAAYCFMGYTQSAKDDKMGPVFGAHVMLKIGNLEVAEELYSKSTSKYGPIPNAEKGKLILFTLMNNKKRGTDQLAATLKLLDEEKDVLKRISFVRIIVPVAIYLRQKDVFQKITKGLSFDQISKYTDLALNFAKGVSLFEVKDEYKRADEVLKAINMEITATLTGATIFKIEPDTVEKLSPFRSKNDKMATIYFDLNAAGWGDEYDFPKASQTPEDAKDAKKPNHE